MEGKDGFSLYGDGEADEGASEATVGQREEEVKGKRRYRRRRKEFCAFCGKRFWLKDLTATVQQYGHVQLVCFPCAKKLHGLSDPGRKNTR